MKTLSKGLYPESDVLQSGRLPVSNLHTLYYEERGSAKGMPVVVLHGGPCGGCPPFFSQFFDPDRYRIILFDQRGAKRSEPAGEMRENTTKLLVEDIEKLREHLGIEKWLVFGGSWGSTLALAYGEAYPDSCLGFILRGVCLGTREDFEHVVFGMYHYFPQEWEAFAQGVSTDDRALFLVSVYERLMDPNPEVHQPLARAFSMYDAKCFTVKPNAKIIRMVDKDPVATLALARGFFHFGMNEFFLEENQLMRDLGRIKNHRAIICHGRYDIVTRPSNAWELHRRWPASDLQIVESVGHYPLEKPLAQALVDATDRFVTSY